VSVGFEALRGWVELQIRNSERELEVFREHNDGQRLGGVEAGHSEIKFAQALEGDGGAHGCSVA